MESSEADPAIYDKPYKPSIPDVLLVKAIINKASRSEIPIDLIDDIIDYASYWPRTFTYTHQDSVRVANTNNPDVLVLRTEPLCSVSSIYQEPPSWNKLVEPHLQYPVRQVIFTLQSRDQGWSGEDQETKGTYSPSYTWFDAELLRFHPATDSEETISTDTFLHAWPGKSKPLSLGDPTVSYRPIFPADKDRPRYTVQRNVQSKRQATDHCIVWDWRDIIDPDSPAAEELNNVGRGIASGDGNFVRQMKLGDCVELWAKARYPGWQNHVESAQVEVFFAV